jgi:hypothetical protein
MVDCFFRTRFQKNHWSRTSDRGLNQTFRVLAINERLDLLRTFVKRTNMRSLARPQQGDWPEDCQLHLD